MKTFWLIFRLAFGAIFIWSGIAKLKDPINFSDAVRNFELVTDPVAPALALLIPCVEVVAGILTMLGLLLRGSLATLLLSLLIFTAAIIMAWVRGLDISCGCFGGSGEMNYPVMIARNIGLIAAALLLLKQSMRPA
ncbi:MAG: DoxX family membrane protein [Verrucomicrobiales bacterium]|nr:DoxX family membrane protein [Verrucomicrobiales bacterium]